jgi:hypothetical protein
VTGTVVSVRGVRVFFADLDAAVEFADFCTRRGLYSEMWDDVLANVVRLPKESEAARALVGLFVQALAPSAGA